MKKFLTSLSFLALFATGFKAKADVDEFQKITSSDAYFGSSVSVSGDTAVVGSTFIYRDFLGFNSGFAYIYEKNEEAEWEEITQLESDGISSLDAFGYSVSISGDVAVVGAPGEGKEDSSADSNTGAVYVYEKNDDGNWERVNKITGEDAEDFFGWSVAIFGDSIIVGALRPEESVGKAYIYRIDEGGPSSIDEVASFKPSDSEGEFGYSVAISNSVAIVGDEEGRAYVYEENEDGEWEKTTTLTASDEAFGDGFGSSLSISENKAIIGAFGDDDLGSLSGSAYIFEKNEEGDWKEVTKLQASDGTKNDVFGYSVSISDNIAVIGAYGDKSSTGTVYVFKENEDGNWEEVTQLVASDGRSNDNLGLSVAISDNTIIAGAYENTSAYIFTPTDEDGDAYFDFSLDENPSDCDDTDSFNSPDPAFEDREIYDGEDNNCDGRIDEGTDAFDDDGDGYTEDGGDCDDSNSSISSSATEIVGDSVDNDCDGSIDERSFLKTGTKPKLIKKI